MTESGNRGLEAEAKAKIFISYSRKDETFAQELVAGLEITGFQPYLDKHDIAAGEEWEARLGRLIEAADTVVFVISPDAVASERCAWEVKRTTELKKRLLPIVWRSVPEAEVPPRLKQLNYIFFDKPHSFGPSLAALATALRTDLDWIREHTRLSEAALRWQQRGRSEALLLRGEELLSAKAWLKAQPQYASEPTLLTHDYINASEDDEDARLSAQRKQLDEIRTALEAENAAQQERAKALEREKAALRRGQRAFAAAVGLFGCVVVGAVGWWKQDWLKEQYHWRMVMGPSVLTPEQERALTPGQQFSECAHGCPRLVVIPAGPFAMGSPQNEEGRDDNEGPQHTVTIRKPFAVGKFDVTFAEWDACVAAGACPRADDNRWGRGDRPVINVSWNDAKLYVAWLSRATGNEYRLLSEAEWERAARGGTNTKYYWGDDIGKGNANCDGCGSQWDNKQTAPVGSFKPNSFDLYDMAGNVWQWVEDCYHVSYDEAPNDGAAWASGDCGPRVVRGASWNNNSKNLRSAGRDRDYPGVRLNVSGFRVARTLSP
jgi:formylglycine-generating enzyme required for sulfatase activity